ncbi:MAG: SDR family NAD(P)-dependent oxidoreductase [Alphaproteobacteria bacterium]|nr:SDR family NAD(P)-dependent oxidoreductase [Alphaproteobacteria bacterium]
MKELKNIAAIVTGGASGMGAATARALAEEGCKVAIWDMNIEAAQKTAQEISGLGIQCDVTSEESVLSALESSAQAHGVARILVNCAGILRGARIVGREGPASLDDFDDVLRVNLLGAFNTMRLVSHALSTSEALNDEGERGVIIHAASIAAFEGQIGQAAYAASKGGVVSMVLPAARELAQFGIRVMGIAPGAVATPMIGEISDDLRASIESNTPFPKRMARPEEFASLALHIINNDMLNGEVIRLDGGTRLAAK